MEKVSCNLLIGVTGSVAALKLPLLIQSLLDFNKEERYNVKIKIVTTENAKHFYDTAVLPEGILLDDNTEWNSWKNRGDPVMHIELVKWADIMVIAPLDANTLAKMAQGFCDNLLTCVTRAWDFSKPLLFCPAMNTKMWHHPVTARHIATLKEWGHTEIPPIKKLLICGDTGIGAMAEVDTIAQTIRELIDEVCKKGN
ncbi:hypothetical protein K1T71_007603 [Dendrolimus kikuchii]|uniref:Uncharacterized protein n=1 Tax=Dendrolimus kikuchii TaxID=765133 RepID=A0ACC1CY49_9NEOP|nr:hypothetical protein K1T71_007603 [Dendrolimus kikuchii]